MRTVFDIAAKLIQKNGAPMSALKLQKMCFYAFGWHAYLTGESLFGERFYAMEYGPVVGELLSAHAGKKSVSTELIAIQQEARHDEPQESDPYVEALINAIWDTYGSMSATRLVNVTHEEAVWKHAWEARATDSKRATLASSDIVNYFVERRLGPEDHIDLPPRLISVMDLSEHEQTRRESGVHQPFVDQIRSLAAAS